VAEVKLTVLYMTSRASSIWAVVDTLAQSHLKRLLIRQDFSRQLPESGVLFLKCHQTLFFRQIHRAILLTVKHDIYNGVPAVDFTGRNLTSRRILMFGSSEKRVFMGMSLCDV